MRRAASGVTPLGVRSAGRSPKGEKGEIKAAVEGERDSRFEGGDRCEGGESRFRN